MDILFTARKVSKYRVISGPYFPAFRLNTERYEVFLRIQSECGKITPEITPYLDTFHAVVIFNICPFVRVSVYRHLICITVFFYLTILQH